MNIDQLRVQRIKLRSSQYTVAHLAEMRRYRLSLIECGYARATKEELDKLKKALNTIEDKRNRV